MTPQTEHDPHAPWRPEGMRDFVVGDRVRVRLSGECQWDGHDTLQDGVDARIGLIWPGLDTHRYLIVFDEPLTPGKSSWHRSSGMFPRLADYFAPNELELLEAAQ